MNLVKCRICGEEKEHQAKGLCYRCYKKHHWKPKLVICKRCGRELPMHAKNLCSGCYNFVFHLDKTNDRNYEKNYGIDINLYKKVTSECLLCGFSKIVDLHHIDQNKKNNSEENLIGICPNHHRMIHEYKHRKEIFDLLKQKGIKVPEDQKIGFSMN